MYVSKSIPLLSWGWQILKDPCELAVCMELTKDHHRHIQLKSVCDLEHFFSTSLLKMRCSNSTPKYQYKHPKKVFPQHSNFKQNLAVYHTTREAFQKMDRQFHLAFPEC